MECKIKMIGFDLDGTLLTSDKQLTKRTKTAIEHAIAQGIVMIPSTGRPMSGVPKEILEIPGIRYVITSNGARVLDIVENIVLFEEILPYDTAGQLLSIFEKYDTLKEIYYSGIGFADKEKMECVEKYIRDPAVAHYIRTTRIPIEDVRDKFETEHRGLDKIQAIFANLEEKDLARKEIEETVENIEIASALSYNIEVNAGGVHKGMAFLKLAEQLEIKRDETMAFGDGSNDTKMLKAAGTAVAMKNAIPEVLEVADIITCSNNEDGVAKIIEQYVLK